jgi:hypothetical protein
LAIVRSAAIYQYVDFLREQGYGVGGIELREQFETGFSSAHKIEPDGVGSSPCFFRNTRGKPLLLSYNDKFALFICFMLVGS